jgi:hypothetical protein
MKEIGNLRTAIERLDAASLAEAAADAAGRNAARLVRGNCLSEARVAFKEAAIAIERHRDGEIEAARSATIDFLSRQIADSEFVTRMGEQCAVRFERVLFAERLVESARLGCSLETAPAHVLERAAKKILISGGPFLPRGISDWSPCVSWRFPVAGAQRCARMAGASRPCTILRNE